MKSYIINILNNSLIYKYIYKLCKIFIPKDQTNINLNLLNPNQKKILICYISLWNKDFKKNFHAQTYHLNQMIYYFIHKGFCIDICELNDKKAYDRLCHNNYDIIIGSGDVYKQFCLTRKIPLKINFITENNPIIVKEKYQERKDYFKQRNPNINPRKSIVRMGYYDISQFKMSDAGILMTSNYNAQTFKPYFNNLNLINCNAIFNENYIFSDKEIIETIDNNRYNFLWFGSTGFIHKGLDLLIDTFKELPNFTLNCYGIDHREVPLFNLTKNKNTINHGNINVLSDDFYKQIILKHNFVLFPSCSEGMSTAIATCMAHGLIPIITKECGIETIPSIIEFQSIDIKTIKKTIMQTLEMSKDEILLRRKECYNYARKNYSLKNFDEQFRNIMDSILQ